jgi:hypothetical protein
VAKLRGAGDLGEITVKGDDLRVVMNGRGSDEKIERAGVNAFGTAFLTEERGIAPKPGRCGKER